MITATPVILSGGSGTRLWPLSRSGFPKQFLSITGGDSLFQQAAKRLMSLENKDLKITRPLIVSGEDHRFIASEQLRETGIDASAFLLEPVGRNTAPALTLAALAALELGNDPLLVVTPADQTITDQAAFNEAMQSAIRQAAADSIVILGITPNRPEIGYGYIQVESGTTKTLSTVKRFVEKPDAITAQSYLDEGGYYWNAGMFVLKASVWLTALERFRPDILIATQASWNKRQQDSNPSIRFVRPDKELFKAVPAESIDYAVMEHCTGGGFDLRMEPLDAGWSDLGAWDAVWQILPKDENGNACRGDVITTGSNNNLVHAHSRLVSLVGVDNLIVIETSDAVMVADQTRSQDVKDIVVELQRNEREEPTLHRKVHRPWGWYDGVDNGERFKVKRIQVKPGASLSLQMHHQRAEHWIVVKGTAEITVGDKTFTLSENQSTYIPKGEVHRLANPGHTHLEIIEVQSGSYLGEDDIVRFEDSYGRIAL